MIQKNIVRDSVRAYLLGEMMHGSLKVGQSLNLAALARTLKVSVTPIREALTQLQQAKIVKAVPNCGFVIGDLNHHEAKELYELIAHLEVLALENSVFDDNAISLLKNQQLAFKNANDTLSRIKTKFKFHELLTQGYPNKLVQQILADLKTRIFFYENTLMSDDSIYDKSDNQHDGIISAIEEDNVPTAELLLKMNWMLILSYIQKQLPN